MLFVFYFSLRQVFLCCQCQSVAVRDGTSAAFMEAIAPSRTTIVSVSLASRDNGKALAECHFLFLAYVGLIESTRGRQKYKKSCSIKVGKRGTDFPVILLSLVFFLPAAGAKRTWTSVPPTRA